MITAKQLRIGLLVDDVRASKYVLDFVKWADSQNSVIITHLILHPRLDDPRKSNSGKLDRMVSAIASGGVRKTLSKILFRTIVTVERVLIKRIVRHRDHLDSFDLSTSVPDQITITPIASKSGFVFRFKDDDIERVRALDLDLLIRCGNGILRGAILNSAKLGIVSFHHADNRINRGGPAGFWEVYLRQDTSGFTLQRLTEELDGGDVLMRGHFQTGPYYLLNQARLFDHSNAYLKHLIAKVAATGKLPDVLPSLPYSGRLFRQPDAREAITYLWCLARYLFQRGYRRLRRIEYIWHVAYTRSDWKNAVYWRAEVLKFEPWKFIADPFVISRSGKDYCFVEEFDFENGKGIISVYDLSTPGGARLGVALEEKFHLSFPFLFEYGGELYMCPEASESRQIRLYRCVDFPLQWEFTRVLMSDVSAVDTMLFQKDDKWWMFTNFDAVGDGDNCSELAIFYADSPFDDHWTAHPSNPIFVDAGRARNAGLVRDGASYFRISQGQGIDIYGKRTLINKIVDLSPTTYVEETIAINTAEFAKNLAGTHHLHSNGAVSVFDFVKLGRVSKAPSAPAR